MNITQVVLLSVISATALVFLGYWLRSARNHERYRRPTAGELAVGFVTNFFDTLGIGSFPTSTAYFRLRRIVSDEEMPGTLNVGHAPAAIAEALIFVTAVTVDPLLLACTTIATALGAWTGAGIVVKLPRRGLQLVLGVGSLIAGVLFCAKNLQLLPAGGVAFALTSWKFAVAVGVTYVLGALMAAGVGLFGPCMITLSLLGMHPIAAFPIMMSSGALQQLVSGLRYLRTRRYAFGTAVGLGIGGVFGVLVAAAFVKQMPLIALRWLVAAVAIYVATSYLRSALAASPNAR